MAIQKCPSASPIFILLLLLLPLTAFGYGLLGPIAAAFGDNGFFCAIGAGGEQEVICWDKDNRSSSSSSSSSSAHFSSLPPMASLSGGEGFMCGITSNSSKGYCWNLASSGMDLIPTSFKYTSYSQIAPGKNHVCAIRGSYYSTIDFGNVDCWKFLGDGSTVDITYNSSFSDPKIDGVAFRKIVSGEGFSCGIVKEGGGVVCWGPKSTKLGLGVSSVSGHFETLASAKGSVCGIYSETREVECWGQVDEFASLPVGTEFVSLSSGAHHFCGICEDDHSVECWGGIDAAAVPKGSAFMAIASSDYTTCAVREVDLVLNCWGVHGQSTPDYSPPLELCSPGVCLPGSCDAGKFAFNASVLNEPDLTSLCIRKDLKICLPCGTNCSKGYFLSSVCNENENRVCTDCSLCQNRSCWDVCGLPPSSSGIREKEQKEMKKLVVIIGSSVTGSLLILIVLCIIFRLTNTKDKEKGKFHFQCTFCAGKSVVEADPEADLQTSLSATTSLGITQVFRLFELKDATHGFKEFNELGRGNFGFVYKAVLSDGRQVAVKRANAATIIHTNSRDFEAELEILCNIRHGNIVNLLGYCAEMGERLLVYEFMPHGTLHDHLHGELSPLDWNLRLKISLQAARGIEYLHKELNPPIVHRDVKTSNILLDSEWVARIADFGLPSANIDRDLNGDMESDVYNFGIVLLEILSGKKAHDRDCSPPDIVEWALPLIRRGRAAAIFDRNVALPRNVEPMLKLADIAGLTLREDPSNRPTISEVVSMVEQTVKNGLTF